MKIIFTNTFKNNNQTINIEEPQPASKFLPEWYKNTKSYLNDGKKPVGEGKVAITIKRCIPIFDSMTSGYIITLPADVYVSIKVDENNEPVQYFEWPALDMITFHPKEQAEKHPFAGPYPYPKFNNPWSIKTPKGYSTLFVQPMHRESIFTILPGIVDTDIYTAPVNFPFIINDINFEGLIPKGTPIAQIIPIKRDVWKMQIGAEKEVKEQNVIATKIQTEFFDRYKKLFWARKEYK
jgi:hypothetical protein